eukprot:3960953-Amphidinium_carterae.2
MGRCFLQFGVLRGFCTAFNCGEWVWAGGGSWASDASTAASINTSVLPMPESPLICKVLSAMRSSVAPGENPVPP